MNDELLFFEDWYFGLIKRIFCKLLLNNRSVMAKHVGVKLPEELIDLLKKEEGQCIQVFMYQRDV